MQYDKGGLDQPLVSDTPPRAGVWTDIGEAEVSNTLFGTATVRIHRRRDALRSAYLWTLAMLLLVVVAVWTVRDMARQPEIIEVVPPALPLASSAPAVSTVPPAMPRFGSPIAPVQDEPAERDITSVRH